MPKHNISLMLDFSPGDRVTHPTYGDGVIDFCQIEIKAGNEIVIYYVVDFSLGSEFRVLRNYEGYELQSREAKKK